MVLPASDRELAVPAAALVEEGRENFLFVQPDPRAFTYVLRKVLVVRRGRVDLDLVDDVSNALDVGDDRDRGVGIDGAVGMAGERNK